jgi:hypothetical protein
MELHLEANPQFYDYLHRIDLFEDGTCRFLDGGGQCIQLNIEGTYKIEYNDDNNGSMEFNFDTEYQRDIFDKHFKVNFKIESDNFIMVDEIVWNSTTENYPFSIYTSRYVFDLDPFEGLYQNRQDNLYFILEGGKESKESIRYFYSYEKKKEKKMKDLNEDELSKIKEINPKLYMAFIENPKIPMKELRDDEDD